MRKVLIANRGEIAVRVVRACRDAGLASVAVYTNPDEGAPFVRMADEAAALGGVTAEPYLAIDELIGAALRAGADAIHPGYGFMSENAEFAQAVGEAGLTWIGPGPDAIRALGDKVTARGIAQQAGAPLVPGTEEPVSTAEEIEAFAAEHGLPVAIKASFGGGGRGMKVAWEKAEIRALHAAAVREATAAFGKGEVFVERYLDRARHVEVQVLADVHGTVLVAGTRDCSLQRRFQKVVEEAPAPFLDEAQRRTMAEAAKAICREVGYLGVGTVEFLLAADGTIAFLEMNTRLQVEHPVTEETAGIDLVREQFRIAEGAALDPDGDRAPRGHSIEFRINSEDASRDFVPATGTVTALEFPTGPGVRVDSGIAAGSHVGLQFDPLLAKLIVTGADRQEALERARRALHEFRLDGLTTLLPFHRAVVDDPAFAAATAAGFAVHTRWIEEDGPGVVEPAPAAAPQGGDRVLAPMPGVVVHLGVQDGDRVQVGDVLVTLEAMKAEHRVVAERDGVVSGLTVQVGDAVERSAALLRITGDGAPGVPGRAVSASPAAVAPPEPAVPVDAASVVAAPAAAAAEGAGAAAGAAAPTVAGRSQAPEPAVATLLRRRTERRERAAAGDRQLTAWERAERLCDPRSFVVPASMRRGQAATYGGRGPAPDGDGVVAGIGTVAGRRVAVVSHDFAVAGGSIGSAFADSVVRVQELAMEIGAPIVYLNDSGGARIHEGIHSLHGCGRIFTQNVRARKIVPQISVIMGPCAGAAAYSPALTDWTIMVRGRGQMFLTGPEVVRTAIGETVDPEDLGGAMLHTRESGVAHLDVPDDRAALDTVRRMLAFLPGRAGAELPRADTVAPHVEASLLAGVVPDATARPFNMRRVLAGVFDGGDELELMPAFGQSLLTGFARLDGCPVGVVASQPKHSGGVLDAQTAVKCARFVDFCGRFGIPVVTVLDVPGFMPGSVEERKGVITHGAAMLAAYVDAAVPKLTLIVRKAYGGSYIAMGSRSLGADFTWAWASAELAVMGPEAAVGLLHRKELAAATDPAETRRALAADYRETVTRPFLAAEAGIVDDVILPEESRDRLVAALHLLMPKESCA